MLQADGNQRMWMGVCVLMNLGVFSGQMNIIPVDTAVGAEVSIQTFGANDVGMLTLLAFLFCSENIFSMPTLSFAFKAAIHIGGFVSSRRGVPKLQNCLVAIWHVLNCSSEISTAVVLSCVVPRYLLFML